MKINHWRDPQGKFAKRKRVMRNRLIVLILIIIAAVAVVKAYNAPKTLKTAPETMFTSKNDICQGNEKCRAKIENLAAQTLLEEEIRQVKSEYESKLTDLENKLELKRQEELSL